MQACACYRARNLHVAAVVRTRNVRPHLHAKDVNPMFFDRVNCYLDVKLKHEGAGFLKDGHHAAEGVQFTPATRGNSVITCCTMHTFCRRFTLT